MGCQQSNASKNLLERRRQRIQPSSMADHQSLVANGGTPNLQGISQIHKKYSKTVKSSDEHRKKRQKRGSPRKRKKLSDSSHSHSEVLSDENERISASKYDPRSRTPKSGSESSECPRFHQQGSRSKRNKAKKLPLLSDKATQAKTARKVKTTSQGVQTTDEFLDRYFRARIKREMMNINFFYQMFHNFHTLQQQQGRFNQSQNFNFNYTENINTGGEGAKQGWNRHSDTNNRSAVGSLTQKESSTVGDRYRKISTKTKNEPSLLSQNEKISYLMTPTMERDFIFPKNVEFNNVKVNLKNNDPRDPKSEMRVKSTSMKTPGARFSMASGRIGTRNLQKVIMAENQNYSLIKKNEFGQTRTKSFKVKRQQNPEPGTGRVIHASKTSLVPRRSVLEKNKASSAVHNYLGLSNANPIKHKRRKSKTLIPTRPKFTEIPKGAFLAEFPNPSFLAENEAPGRPINLQGQYSRLVSSSSSSSITSSSDFVAEEDISAKISANKKIEEKRTFKANQTKRSLDSIKAAPGLRKISTLQPTHDFRRLEERAKQLERHSLRANLQRLNSTTNPIRMGSLSPFHHPTKPTPKVLAQNVQNHQKMTREQILLQRAHMGLHSSFQVPGGYPYRKMDESFKDMSGSFGFGRGMTENSQMIAMALNQSLPLHGLRGAQNLSTSHLMKGLLQGENLQGIPEPRNEAERQMVLSQLKNLETTLRGWNRHAEMNLQVKGRGGEQVSMYSGQETEKNEREKSRARTINMGPLRSFGQTSRPEGGGSQLKRCDSPQPEATKKFISLKNGSMIKSMKKVAWTSAMRNMSNIDLKQLRKSMKNIEKRRKSAKNEKKVAPKKRKKKVIQGKKSTQQGQNQELGSSGYQRSHQNPQSRQKTASAVNHRVLTSGGKKAKNHNIQSQRPVVFESNRTLSSFSKGSSQNRPNSIFSNKLKSCINRAEIRSVTLLNDKEGSLLRNSNFSGNNQQNLRVKATRRRSKRLISNITEEEIMSNPEQKPSFSRSKEHIQEVKSHAREGSKGSISSKKVFIVKKPKNRETEHSRMQESINTSEPDKSEVRVTNKDPPNPAGEEWSPKRAEKSKNRNFSFRLKKLQNGGKIGCEAGR